MMTPNEEIIWLAGLLEGEACFWTGYIRCTTTQITIKLEMADEDIVIRASKIMNGTAIVKIPGKKVGYKDTYSVHCTNDKAYSLMMKILPYMGIRRTARIKECMEAYAKRSTRREANQRNASHRKRCPQTASLF